MRALAALLAAGVLASCGPDPEAAIAGSWAVDVDRWLADPSLGAVPDDVRAALDPIARAQVAEAGFRFEDGRCTRRVARRTWSIPCRVHDVENGAVVVRATLEDGGVDWIRVRPDGDRARLGWGRLDLPLVRVRPTADGAP